MTTQQHVAHRTCRRCHGSGHEPPGPSYTAEQEATLDTLEELGVERAKLQSHRAYMTTDGRKRLNEIYTQVRSVVAAAEKLGVRKLDMQVAVGVSSAAFYNILTGKTGA